MTHDNGASDKRECRCGYGYGIGGEGDPANCPRHSKTPATHDNGAYVKLEAERLRLIEQRNFLRSCIRTSAEYVDVLRAQERRLDAVILDLQDRINAR